MRMVKAGIIGLGFIGPIHVEALRRTGLADVVAIAHSNPDASEQKARALGVPKAYDDYRQLLADSNIEAVHICTPNDSHHAIAKGAMLAGKHVICEKPLTTDIDEARDLIEIASRTGVVCAVNYNMRFYPMLYQARELIQSGALGEIFSIGGSYTQDWMLLDSDYNWRVEPERAGSTRVIGDIGSSWCDAVEFMTDARIEQLCADIAIFHRTRKKPLKPIPTFLGKEIFIADNETERIGVRSDDYASMMFRMDNGAHGTMSLSQCFAGRKNRLYIEIAGQKKSLAFDSERPNELWLGNRDKANEELIRDPSLMTPSARAYTSYPGGHNEGYCDTMKQLFSRVYSYILEGKARAPEGINFPTLEDGLRSMILANAMLRSQKQMNWISI